MTKSADEMQGPTKGPWVVSGGVRRVASTDGKIHLLYCADIVVGEDDPNGFRGHIASIQSADFLHNGITCEEAAANARLIAAAPDLLKALEEIEGQAVCVAIASVDEVSLMLANCARIATAALTKASVR